MAYKTKIIPQGTNYIGHLYSGDQLVYTTNVHKDPIMVSRELGSHVGKITAPPAIPNNPSNTIDIQNVVNNPAPIRNISTVDTISPSVGEPAASPPVRRCCGRG